MKIRFTQTLTQQGNKLQSQLTKAALQCEERLVKAQRRVGQRWVGEAQKRAPVDTGTMRQRIFSNTTVAKPGVVFTEVGTNVKYAAFVEFGTKYIAKGNVLRVGRRVDVTDRDAVVVWPAKNYSLVDEATGKQTRAGKALERKLAKGGLQEQMPWLRPAFQAIKEWALEEIKRTVGRI